MRTTATQRMQKSDEPRASLNGPSQVNGQRPAQSHPEMSVMRAVLAPSSLGPSDLQHLQRAIGNRATRRLLNSLAPGIQAKLVVSPARDQHEMEADRVARQVVGMMNDSRSHPAASIQTAQPKTEDEEEKPTSIQAAQRKTEDEEEKPTSLQAAGIPEILSSQTSGVVQRGLFDFLGPLNPREYVPEALGGYTPEQMQVRLEGDNLTGSFVPADNFGGRSNVRLGINEIVALNFNTLHGSTAAALGGLRWVRAAGNGTLTPNIHTNDDGRATFTADAPPGAVRLELRIVRGRDAGRVIDTKNITVVAPNDAVMAAGPVRHFTNTWSAGFRGQANLRPIDVSFSRIEWSEGAAPAVATGYLAVWNGIAHNQTAWFGVGGGDSVNGCRVNMVDDVKSGSLAVQPYAVGDFNWPIPWQYRVNAGNAVVFTTANHHAVAAANGQASIEKKGSGLVSAMPADPTADWP